MRFIIIHILKTSYCIRNLVFYGIAIYIYIHTLIYSAWRWL